MSRSSASSKIGWVIGALLAAAGAGTLLISQLTQPSFGLFGAPSGTDFAFVIGKTAMLPHATIIGALVLTAGLVVLSFLLGRRSARKAVS